MIKGKINYNGAEVSYKKTGQGFPVVLLHGFAENGEIWDTLSPALSQTNTVIIPDIPGSGESPLIKGEQITMEHYAEVINNILEAEKYEKVIMIGHSMGGYITLAFAELFPGKLLSAGLFHSSAYADDEAKIDTRLKAIASIRDYGSIPFLKASIPGIFKDPVKSRGDIDDLLNKGNSFLPDALIQYYEAMIHRPDRTHLLSSIHIPWLFVIGEHDKAVPFEHSLTQSQLPSHSYVQILRESAHMGMLEESKKCKDILANFFHDIIS
ncbi:MAG: alpha/beta hydrolase [Ferruginibacter sp.]